MRQQHGPAKTSGTGENAADVIGMLMGDQHRIDGVGREAQALQPPRHFARTESSVDRQTGIAGLDQQGVAGCRCRATQSAPCLLQLFVQQAQDASKYPPINTPSRSALALVDSPAILR